jgi:hypothetical protein
MRGVEPRQLRELETFDSIGAQVLSLYLPVEADPGFDLVTLATRMVRALGADLDEAGEADLVRELDVVRDYLGSLLAAPRSLAIFTCSRRGFFRVFRLDSYVEPQACWSGRAQVGQLREALEADAAAREVLAARVPVSLQF